MKVLRLLMVLLSWAATPKSATFTSPASVNRMLPHLMSLCTYTPQPLLSPMLLPRGVGGEGETLFPQLTDRVWLAEAAAL